MGSIISTIEIDRPAEEVFSYATDPARFHEWQQDVVSARMKGDEQQRLGAQFVTTRRIGRNERTMTQEISEFEPPARWAARGVDGPLRAMASVNIVPLDENNRSRLTIELDFEGHGIGKLLVPLVVQQAKKVSPKSYQNLKEQLEHRHR